MKTTHRVLALLPLLALSGVAMASGDGHHIPLQKIGLHALNLVILLGLVGFLTRKMIRDGLADRAATIKAAIESSDKALAAAQEKADALEAKAAGFEQLLAEMRTEAEVEATAERARLLEKADAEAAAIQSGASRSIRNEVERARNTLRREAAELAVQLAADQVAARISDDDHARLARDFLGALKADEVKHG